MKAKLRYTWKRNSVSNWQNDPLASIHAECLIHSDLARLRQPELQRANGRRVAHRPLAAGGRNTSWETVY